MSRPGKSTGCEGVFWWPGLTMFRACWFTAPNHLHRLQLAHAERALGPTEQFS